MCNKNLHLPIITCCLIHNHDNEAYIHCMLDNLNAHLIVCKGMVTVGLKLINLKQKKSFGHYDRTQPNICQITWQEILNKYMLIRLAQIKCMIRRK